MNSPALVKSAGRCEIKGHKRRECSLIFRRIASLTSHWELSFGYYCSFIQVTSLRSQRLLVTSEPEAVATGQRLNLGVRIYYRQPGRYQ